MKTHFSLHIIFIISTVHWGFLLVHVLDYCTCCIFRIVLYKVQYYKTYNMVLFSGYVCTIPCRGGVKLVAATKWVSESGVSRPTLKFQVVFFPHTYMPNKHCFPPTLLLHPPLLHHCEHCYYVSLWGKRRKCFTYHDVPLRLASLL